MKYESLILGNKNDDEGEILSIADERDLKKKLEEDMNKELE